LRPTFKRFASVHPFLERPNSHESTLATRRFDFEIPFPQFIGFETGKSADFLALKPHPEFLSSNFANLTTGSLASP
jgi:hypothetical protein